MIKKIIKYKDYNGNECEETHYFNLSKMELTKIEVGYKNGMEEYIKEAIKTDDRAGIIELFDRLILDAYGIKSEDGKRFIKSPELREAFKQSAAYSELFMELVTDPKAAEAFMKGISEQ